MLKTLFWIGATLLTVAVVAFLGWQFLLACSALSIATLLWSSGASASRLADLADEERFRPTTSFARF